MSSEPTPTQERPERRESALQEKAYVAQKLRAAAVMYGPSVALDLFQGAWVVATVFGVLPDPQRTRAGRILRPIAAAGALAPWAYLLVVRPWHMNWGATEEEVRESLPGDDLVPHPALASTRALTVRAPAGEVWRWLVQLGQDRGGFYSYAFLENLAAADIHNVDRIVPEMQQLRVGDFVPMAPVEWGVPMGGFTVVEVEPGRAIVWRQGWPEDVEDLSSSEAESRGKWAFVLEEIGEGATRLILGERSGLKPGTRDVSLNYLFLERQHFVMVRRMLKGIKERAERARAVLEREIAIDRPVEDVFDFVTASSTLLTLTNASSRRRPSMRMSAGVISLPEAPCGLISHTHRMRVPPPTGSKVSVLSTSTRGNPRMVRAVRRRGRS